MRYVREIMSVYRMLNESHRKQAGRHAGALGRLHYLGLAVLFATVSPFIPVHDSWSKPKTPEEQELLRQRLESLECMSRVHKEN